ncbi:MAG: hypothetical protein M3Y72_14475 [Acidobacteriota bacterium]|nr:hypothetical protein [Acidobacteriota bacterium]
MTKFAFSSIWAGFVDRHSQRLSAFALSHSFRSLLTMALVALVISLPLSAQFTGGTTQVDPTVGAQTVAKYIVDGVLYCVAAVAFVCFCWGIVQLFRRPLEGILEVAVGLTVMYLIGHSLGWTSALTGVTTG